MNQVSIKPSAVLQARPASTSLHAFIVDSAAAGLVMQQADGSMPAGHNGPHGDPERPSRNTGHWLMKWVFAHARTGERRFLRAADAAADYLLDPGHRPGGYTFHHRDSPRKDRCNGLMGSAFNLEALVAGGLHLGRDDMLQLAEQIVSMHPYDEGSHVWLIREIDGRVLGTDMALNHQIWFAAGVSMVLRAGGARPSAALDDFMRNLSRTMSLRRNGRIRHELRDACLPARLKRLARRKPQWKSTVSQAKREIAYHFFNIYPLTILRLNIPENEFWESETFVKAYAYRDSNEYRVAAADPGFVEPYIPAGFPLSFAERAWANQVFGPADPDFQSSMVTTQIARTCDFATNLLTRGSSDPVTQAARCYEMTRLDDVDFGLF